MGQKSKPLLDSEQIMLNAMLRQLISLDLGVHRIVPHQAMIYKLPRNILLIRYSVCDVLKK